MEEQEARRNDPLCLRGGHAASAGSAAPASGTAALASGTAAPASGAAGAKKREAPYSNAHTRAKKARAARHQEALQKRGMEVGPLDLDPEIPPLHGHCLGCYAKGYRSKQCNTLGPCGRPMGKELCGKCCREQGGCPQHRPRPRSSSMVL